MSWPSKKAGSDPLLWGRNSISDVIADARASLQQPSRPFTPRNLTQVSANLWCSLPSILCVHQVRSLHVHTAAASEMRPSTPVLPPQAVRSPARVQSSLELIPLVWQLLDLSSNRPVTPAPDSWIAQLRISRDKIAPPPAASAISGLTREKDRPRALSWDCSGDHRSSALGFPPDSQVVTFESDDLTNDQLPSSTSMQPSMYPSPPPRAAPASTTIRSSRPLIPSRMNLIATTKSLDSQILNLCCQLDSECSSGCVEAVVAHALQLLAAANAAADGSSVSEPMRRALVKSVSAQMTTEDPQRLLDFSAVLLAALQHGSSRNRTVVKVIYKVSKTSANDSLFAARPRLLQLMAEVVQSSSDPDAVL